MQETLGTPQPTVVADTGKSWKFDIPTHHQDMIYGGPLKSKNYRLKQFHAHWGDSEHLIDGQQMDGELHLVHYHIKYKNLEEAFGYEGGLAVVAIMLKIHPSEYNQEFEKIGEVLPQIKSKGQSAQTAEHVDLENILPVDRNYCTWVVLKKPVMVSNRVMDMMKEFRYGGESSYKMVNCRKAASSVQCFFPLIKKFRSLPQLLARNPDEPISYNFCIPPSYPPPPFLYQDGRDGKW